MPAARKNDLIFQRRRPAQARSRVTVEAILEASARIIRQDGAAGLTTNRIAEVAGVSIGTLYGYFPDKSAILVALGRQVLEQDEAAILTALDAEAARGEDAEPDLAVIRALVARHRTEPVLRRVVMTHHIGLGLGGEHASRAQEVIGEVAKRLSSHGQLPSDPMRVFIVTRAILGVCRTLTEEGDTAAFDSEALARELTRMIRVYSREAEPALSPGPE